MSKTKNNKNDRNKKNQVNKLIPDESLFTLVIDKEDSYLNNPNTIYLNPNRLGQVRFFNDKILDAVLIKNTEIDLLSGFNLKFVLTKMKINSKLEVVLTQPLLVMQMYEAKQIEANLKLADFDNVEISEYEYDDETTLSKVKTLIVSAVRPEKNPNLLEISIKKERNL